MESCENGIIDSTMLGVEDHGILTCMVHIRFDGSGQGFGGYGFDRPIEIDGQFSHREGVAYGMEFIRRILKVVGVSRWEDLPGKNIRVKHTGEKISAIGHIVKDKWFTPTIDLKHMQ